MGKDPDAIRREIEETRAQMDDTVEAIGYKADVPSRAKEAVTGKVDAVKSKVSDTATRAKEAVVGTASRAGEAVGDAASRAADATPDRGDAKRTAKRAVGLAQENPLGLAIGAAAVGFLAGLLVPSTRVEDEKLGPLADQVKDRARETGQEAVERGKEVAQQVAESAAGTAREQVQRHGEGLADSARQSTEEVVDQARYRAGS